MSTMQTAMKMAPMRSMLFILGGTRRARDARASDLPAPAPMFMTARVRATSNTCYAHANLPLIRSKLAATGTR